MLTSSSQPSIKRRRFLSGLMKLLVFIGFIFVSIPFFSSFSSNEIDDKNAIASRWIINLPVTEINPGKVNKLTWVGGIVWIYGRTKKDIQSLEKHNLVLRDPFSKESDQPEHMQNNLRSASEAYFVFIPQENKRGCQVSLHDDGQDENHNESKKALFTEPCFSAKFDAAGRILKSSGQQEQKNLAVPNHIIENGILKIGIWSPTIK